MYDGPIGFPSWSMNGTYVMRLHGQQSHGVIYLLRQLWGSCTSTMQLS